MTNEDVSPDEQENTAVDEPAADAEPKNDPAPTKRGGGNGIAWLALLLAAAALIAVAYGLFLDWRTTDDSANLESEARLAAVAGRIDDTNAAVAALEQSIGIIDIPDYSADIAAVSRSVDDQLRLLDSLPARLSTLENSVASLAGISQGARETFLLAEAEYYMQIANAQLQLANNPQLATLALKMADERVTQMSDPALIDVRRALSDELTALEVMQKPDLEGATLTLASLARVVESLPVGSPATAGDAEASASDEDQGAMASAWGSVKDAFSGWVTVTRPEDAKLIKLSPDGEQFLRNNVALQLQAARLALLRGEQAIFEQTLNDTSALLHSYFDTSSTQVANAQQTLEEIRNGVFTVAAPDISGSLRLLRQFRSLGETAE